MLLPWPYSPITLSIKPQQFCLAAQQHCLAQLKGTVLSSPFQNFLALALLIQQSHKQKGISSAMQ